MYIGELHQQLPDGGAGCMHILSTSSGSLPNVQYTSGGKQNNDNHSLTKPFPQNRWTRISIDVVEKASVPNVSVRIDGEVALQDVPIPQCGVGGDATVFAGLYCSSGTHEARYDNLKLDAK